MTVSGNWFKSKDEYYDILDIVHTIPRYDLIVYLLGKLSTFLDNDRGRGHSTLRPNGLNLVHDIEPIDNLSKDYTHERKTNKGEWITVNASWRDFREHGGQKRTSHSSTVKQSWCHIARKDQKSRRTTVLAIQPRSINGADEDYEEVGREVRHVSILERQRPRD